jgi:hypothetical protein
MNQDLSDFLPNLFAKIEAEWKCLAGDHLEVMLASRDGAIKQLDAAQANVRNAAYQILLKKWPTDSDILPQCMHAIEFDSDIEVRVRALYYLAALYKGKSDLAASRFLSKIALSPETPVRIREATYLSLLRIQGQPLPSPLIKSIKTGDHSAFGDIDWSFVIRFSADRE